MMIAMQKQRILPSDGVAYALVAEFSNDLINVMWAITTKGLLEDTSGFQQDTIMNPLSAFFQSLTTCITTKEAALPGVAAASTTKKGKLNNKFSDSEDENNREQFLEECLSQFVRVSLASPVAMIKGLAHEGLRRQAKLQVLDRGKTADNCHQRRGRGKGGALSRPKHRELDLQCIPKSRSFHSRQISFRDIMQLQCA